MSTQAQMPTFIEPMLAKLGPLPADDSAWAFEIKWDGVRILAHAGSGPLRLLSRTGNNVTRAYPELAGLGDTLAGHAAILDGEVVAFDEDGQLSFQALQGRMHLRDEAQAAHLAQSVPVTYLIFDLLWLDGRDLTGLPYTERRQLLEQLGVDQQRWQVPEFQRGDGARLLALTRERQLEGIMAKPLHSRYLPGSRGSWVKIKNSRRQEFVIGGWTSGKGARSSRIGALHLGVHDGDELRYVGRVGTGFGASELERLGKLLAARQRSSSPFDGRQPPRGAHFTEPELVCEVEFSEWTQAGTLRQPSYKGLRDDKPAAAVTRERPTAAPATPAAPAEPAEPAADGDGKRAPAGARGDAPPDLDALLAGGREIRNGVEIELDGRALKFTNLDKVLYPACGFTKRELIGYYAAVSPVLLAHLRDRPLTLKRYPDGVDGKFFYEKRAPRHRPDWVRTVTVSSDRGRPEIPYTLCQDLPTLLWLANLADIELHPLLGSAAAVDRPTAIVFDLDPGAPADITQCCEVALELRKLLDGLGLQAFPKTSGSKGLQLIVPLNLKDASYEQTKPLAHAAATLLTERFPARVVADMAKSKREGKVLIDWSQNDPHKTTVSVYSLRAKAQPSASTPVSWEEVAACAQEHRPQLLSFTAEQLLRRVAADGDRFGEVLVRQQHCPVLEA